MIPEMIPGIFAAVVFLISTPFFVIFSPVLVPAAIATTLLATGFTASGSLLSMAMSILSWIIKKRTGLDKLKIPGVGSSIVEAKDEDQKARLKGQKGEKDEKKKKQLKKDIKDKQKIDKKKEKKKDR